MGLISRRSACLEWSQKASDPERKKQLNDIAGILRTLKCGEVADEERALREKYAGNPDTIKALDATWVKVVKRLPVQIAPDSPQQDLNR
jgi:hypothetical protein